MKLLYILILLFFFSSCKDNPVTSKDTPPIVQYLDVSPSSANIGDKVKAIFSATDEQEIDSAAVEFGDGARHSFPANHQKTLVDSIDHAYTTPGSKLVTFIVYATGKTATASKTVSVAQDLPPVVASYLNGIEGQSSSVSCASFAQDPEGKPVTISVKTGNPSVNVSVAPDSIRYSGVNTDVSGNFPVTFNVSDGVNSIDKVVSVIIDGRDDILGVIGDAMEGTLPATLKPELVMAKPFDLSKSYLKIDNTSISMDANGNFKSPKLVPGAHILEVAVANMTGDSSFIMTYNLLSGDQTFNPKVNTNAGTGFSLADLKEFYYTVNFSFNGGNQLNGIDFSHANEYTYWIARKDTVIDAIMQWQAFTVEQQNTVEQYIRDEIFKYLPDSLQPRIYTAALNESLPLMWEQGLLRATPNTLLIARRDGPDGEVFIYDRERDGTFESAIITYDHDADKSTVLQEAASSLFGSGGVRVNKYYGKTVSFEGAGATSYLTNIDIKLLYLPINFKPGSSPEDICKLW